MLYAFFWRGAVVHTMFLKSFILNPVQALYVSGTTAKISSNKLRSKIKDQIQIVTVTNFLAKQFTLCWHNFFPSILLNNHHAEEVSNKTVDKN
jgi:hypothetical protein